MMGSNLEERIAERNNNTVGQHEPGAKLDQGKTQASLLGMFARALLAVADVGTHGVAKYSRGGWQFVDDGMIRYDDAKWRHMLQGYIEPTDADSGLEHMAQEAWNALAKLELHLRELEEVK